MEAKKYEKTGLGRILCALMFFFLFLYLGMRYMGMQEYSYVLSWWLMLIILGIVMQPLCIILFKRFHDGGWIFAKALGIGACGWLTWFLASLKIAKFSYLSTILSPVIVLIIGLVVFYFTVLKKNREFKLSEFYTRDRLISMLCAEVIFFCVFVIWCYLRGCNPAAYGTERMMDYGFMLTIFKSDYMPAVDMWFAGKGINYYYFGQYLAAYLTKLASVPVTHGYNIDMAMLAAFGFGMPYSIVNNLVRVRLVDRCAEKLTAKEEKNSIMLGEMRDEKPFIRPVFAGTLAGISVAFSSTMHYPVFKYFLPKLRELQHKEPLKEYFFSNPTRYIGFYHDRDDKPIHEFPAYSYTLGDLHAHVCNTIMVMTLLAILFAILLRRKEKIDTLRLTGETEPPKSFLMEVFHPTIIACAFLSGLFRMSNFWDFPIYFVVSGAVILFSNLLVYEFRGNAWLLTLAHAGVFIVISKFVSLPYDLKFDSISTGIGITFRHTWFREFLVVWGLPTACLIVFATVLLLEMRKAAKQKAEAAGKKKVPEEDDEYADSFWERLFTSLRVSDLFVLTIMLCAAGLVLIPEIIFVRDIYGGAYERSNTMFKLSYQAFIMYGIGMAYVVSRLTFIPKSKFQKAFGILAILCMLLCSNYFWQCRRDWFGKEFSTMDATAFLPTVNKDDAEMIQYINDNIEGQPVIMENGGLSYTFFNRISVFTGNPTVVGWWTHEYLWRSSGKTVMSPEQQERNDDIRKLYTSQDVNEVRTLLKKYKVDYIYYGQHELVNGFAQKTVDSNTDMSNLLNLQGSYYEKWDTNLNVLLSLGDIVKVIPATGSKQYTTYLIKVRPIK